MSAAASSFAVEVTDKAEKLVLDNGATVVCKHMPGSPLVTIEIGALSGLSNEGEYAGSGISHLLEHLIFKGTALKPGSQISREIKALGGIVNASTGLDSAAYYLTVPVDNFEKALDILVDMVMDPAFTEEDLAKEKDIIKKEIKLHEDDPESRQLELLFAEAYRESVYRHPIIGTVDRLEKLTREDVLEYHSASYAPDRIVVGIAGGVAPSTALDAARKKLSGYNRNKTLLSGDTPTEPRQLEPRKTSFPASVNLGYLSIGFHTTSFYSPELYKGDVLSTILGEGNDSRLYRRLVEEKQLLYTVSTINYTPRYPGLFIVAGVGDPDKLDAARAEIFAVIEEIRTGKIDETEMERARNTVLSEYFRSHESSNDVAAAIATSQLMAGDPDFYDRYVEGVKRVTAEDVRSVLAGHLRERNSTTVRLVPKGASFEAASEKNAVKGEEPERSLKLDSGLRVFVKKRSRLPIVSATLAFPAGVLAESRAKNGISNFTSSILLKGTKQFKADEIVPAIERMGGNVSSFSGLSSSGITMTMLSKDLDRGMEILYSCVQEPVFDETEISKLKAQALASIKERDNDIFEKGFAELLKLLYKAHPYSMQPLGTKESVGGITREDLRDFYSRRFMPDGAVLVIVGDVDVDKILSDISRRFGRWKGKSAALAIEEIKPIEGRETADLDMEKMQSLVLLGYGGVPAGDEREYSLSFISSLLSGSDGLLYEAFRSEDGLAYATGAVTTADIEPGYFAVFAATTEDNIPRVTETVGSLVNRIRAGGLTDEDVSACRNKILSQFAASIESNQALSMQIARDELRGLGFARYQKIPGKISGVTKDDIVKCAKDLLGENSSALVTIHSSTK